MARLKHEVGLTVCALEDPKTTSGFAFDTERSMSSRQRAAVRTHRGAIKVPEQTWVLVPARRKLQTVGPPAETS